MSIASNGAALRLGVVIPTLERPQWLTRAYRSLAEQEAPPDSVCIVCRETDVQSLERARELVAEGRLPTRMEVVRRRGHMPPVAVGCQALAGDHDLVALLDDDAEAEAGWAERARSAFMARPRLGALGGRVRNFEPDGLVEQTYLPVQRASYFHWLGRVAGDMYKPATFSERPAVAFMGGNCCLRSEVWRQLEFDWRLNRDVAFHYEMDLAFQVLALGYEVRYDPAWTIKHFNAPRARQGLRGNSTRSLFVMCYNLVRIYARRLVGVRRAHMLAGEIFVGSRRAPGLASVIPLLLLDGDRDVLRRFAAAHRGRLRSLAELLGPRP